MEEMLTKAVPTSATRAERKLKKRAFETLKPDLTRIPKSPTCTEMHQQEYLKSSIMHISSHKNISDVTLGIPGKNTSAKSIFELSPCCRDMEWVI